MHQQRVQTSPQWQLATGAQHVQVGSTQRKHSLLLPGLEVLSRALCIPGHARQVSRLRCDDPSKMGLGMVPNIVTTTLSRFFGRQLHDSTDVKVEDRIRSRSLELDLQGPRNMLNVRLMLGLCSQRVPAWCSMLLPALDKAIPDSVPCNAIVHLRSSLGSLQPLSCCSAESQSG